MIISQKIIHRNKLIFNKLNLSRSFQSQINFIDRDPNTSKKDVFGYVYSYYRCFYYYYL